MKANKLLLVILASALICQISQARVVEDVTEVDLIFNKGFPQFEIEGASNFATSFNLVAPNSGPKDFQVSLRTKAGKWTQTYKPGIEMFLNPPNNATGDFEHCLELLVTLSPTLGAPSPGGGSHNFTISLFPSHPVPFDPDVVPYNFNFTAWGMSGVNCSYSFSN